MMFIFYSKIFKLSICVQKTQQPFLSCKTGECAVKSFPFLPSIFSQVE